jgi:hypothetical protein
MKARIRVTYAKSHVIEPRDPIPEGYLYTVQA